MTATSSVGAGQPGVVEQPSGPSHRSLKDLLAYWLAKKGDRIAPPRSAIHPEEIVTLLPYLALIDVVGEPARFRVRLFGTGLVAAYGRDITGKFLDEVDFDSVGKDLISHAAKVARECRPEVIWVVLKKRDEGRYIEYERIGLPLSEDGRTVNMLLWGVAVTMMY